MEDWKSPRRIAVETRATELAHQVRKYQAFDTLIDLALEGAVTFEEALEAFKFDCTSPDTAVL